MTPPEIEALRAELARAKPARVLVYQGDAEVRRIAVPNTKKRWQTVIGVLAKLDFTRVELTDKAGGLLAVWDAPIDEVESAAPASAVTAREEGLMRLILSAQKEAFAHVRAETAAASQACVQALGVLSTAVESLASVHRATLESQAQAFNAQLQAALAQPAPEGGDLQSTKLLELLAPMLIPKLAPLLMGAAGAEPPKNGANHAPK